MEQIATMSWDTMSVNVPQDIQVSFPYVLPGYSDQFSKCIQKSQAKMSYSQGAGWSWDSRLLEWIFTLRSQY